jgi:hypothetical protein
MNQLGAERAAGRSPVRRSLTRCLSGILLLLAPSQRTYATDENAPPEDRRLVETVLRELLIKELSELELESKDSHTQELRVGPLRSKVTAESTAKGRFDEPEEKLVVEVPTMIRHSGRRTQIVAKAKAPFKGILSAKLESLRASVGFSATASIEVHSEIKQVEDPGGSNIRVVVTDWSGKVSDVHFDDDIADALGAVARGAANKWLEDNREELKKRANRALQEAYAKGRLRL